MGEALLVRRGGALDETGIFIEPGLIVEWFGLASNVPEGWLLCDGQNDTPNLIDQFIIGAGDTYAIDATGGSADAILVSHNHTITTNTAGAHSHSANRGDSVGLSNTASASALGNIGSTGLSGNGNHSHTITFTSTGESATNANLPPYLGLFHIIKVEE